MTTEEVHDQYIVAQFSPEIVKNFKELFPEHGDLTYEEVLEQQVSVYQSLQGNERNKGSTSDVGQSSDWSQFSGQEGESSRGRSCRSVESQLALDEALARSLQDLGDNFSDLYTSEPIDNTAGNTGVSSIGTPSSSIGTPVRSGSPDVRQDDIDPDGMTYEQLQSLGDSIGSESKGLSEELISRLPYFKYKTGLFSKKKKKEECVICFTQYKSGDYLITLPCAHQYHSKCITHWLKINKTCPVCKVEVNEY
ncbi:E3 ubiquitin ligase BIG BROTHER-related-like [Cornus florida]|uniref:E3 ubiquitin ligase BIG BROTHER-related-like n=1 Tax=Cornus florida TaxID=4283 RepID=UPI0028A22A77|nr:E3 ubiquitin ligase BIG BROTHER-related-like [Cornus florida]XP_059667034.1 E3 ubiquitin ligase BIG BROTHER-related-like [Cornus florida]XP_059667035.1 E3 ubiquitin ligase BIG BROTHER-related-like [Cornus florida]XP_059667036.1 E3 ubiquitin ligase BIG BROTHER-related-like [Cornus florida]XP_059667037.1 E3 ubiquitin ligase BIG BROTHER-related-like [Cornus florida]XP_059667038.1 E3 ubiquitin ligase BIG BROTHER-related-like [Cornus florida]XP_059667040.1 E3 ubiquitin ligase BIG BROTHER-relate